MKFSENKILLRITKILLLVLVFFFVGKNIADNSSNIKEIDLSSLSYIYLLPVFLITMISMFIPVFSWKYLLGVLGAELKIFKAVKIWFISNMGRYIPGKVWQLSGLIVLSKREGVSKKISSVSVVYSQVVANLLGLSMGIFLLDGETDYKPYISVIILIIFILPYIIDNVIALILKLSKKEVETVKTKYVSFLIYVLSQLINWLVMGISFILFINIFTNLSIFEHPVSLFILPISWTAGLLAVFAPGGIGVREGIMTVYLAMFIDPAFAAVIPWVYRIWITVFEVVLAGVFYLKSDRTKQIKYS